MWFLTRKKKPLNAQVHNSYIKLTLSFLQEVLCRHYVKGLIYQRQILRLTKLALIPQDQGCTESN